MNQTWKKINAGNCRYLSEIKDFEYGLPNGVINKTLPDVGGTYLCANCKHNYIIVCPTVDLVKSIARDKKNKYPVFECYSSIKKIDYDLFIEEHNPEYIKIATTYDKLKYVKDWINPKDFKILIDEYHILLQAIDFRETVINEIYDYFLMFKSATFISATPINIKFEISKLRDLPHYEITWDRTIKLYPIRKKTVNVVRGLTQIVDSFIKGSLYAPNIELTPTKVDELFIFINSVSSIKQVCDTLDIDESLVKICCSNKKTNSLILEKYKIDEVTSPNKKINFFTSKCFQGCNLFTNNGLIIVCSDSNRKSMVTDLSSDLIQIAGRLRFNTEYQNEFRNIIVHLYNTNSDVQSDEEFELHMSDLKVACNNLLKIQENNPNEVHSMIERLNLKYDIVTIENDKLVYSENKEMYFRYFHQLKQCYKNGVTVRNSYSSKIEPTRQQFMYSKFDKELSSLVIANYQTLVTDYYNSDFDDSYTKEYPEFLEYKKYLTIKEINSMRFNKEKLMMTCKSKSRLNDILESIVSDGEFYTISYLKSTLNKKFKENNVNISPKASLIEELKGYSVKRTKKNVGGKMENGYLVKKIIQ